MDPIEEDEIRSTRKKQYQQYQDYLDSVDAASTTSPVNGSQIGVMNNRAIKKVSAENSLIGRVFAQHVK